MKTVTLKTEVKNTVSTEIEIGSVWKKSSSIGMEYIKVYSPNMYLYMTEWTGAFGVQYSVMMLQMSRIDLTGFKPCPESEIDGAWLRAMKAQREIINPEHESTTKTHK